LAGDEQFSKTVKATIDNCCKLWFITGIVGSPFNSELRNIGESLLKYSESSDTTARGLVTELFPYIYVASKRMSSRTISEFLKTSHSVKISAASVARALREPEKHMEGLFESIEPAIRIFAEAHDVEASDILEDEKVFEAVKNEPPLLNSKDQSVMLDSQREYDEAVSTLSEEWFSLDERFRDFAVGYFWRMERGEQPSSESEQ